MQLTINAQDNLYTSYTTPAARIKLFRNLVNNSINKNLSFSLNDSTEDRWAEAFSALELLLYKNNWVDEKINKAFDSLQSRSAIFQRELMELAYTNYPGIYINEISALLQETNDPKVFAMCAEYILQVNHDGLTLDNLEETIIKKFSELPDDPLISMLSDHLLDLKFPPVPLIKNPFFPDLLSKKFLPGEIIMYSFQRSNRDHPGLVIIRDKNGDFIKDSMGQLFNVPQLARSITNLPGYLTNGNTPQGIFRMHGFDVSMSNFIGPSPNIQLSMPIETSMQKFFHDETIDDTVWSKVRYKQLLPPALKNYTPLYGSYFAGLAGRTEIISHGTTISPEYYKGKPFYPLTPSQGCLCTKEIWNGKRIESDQQKLINALLKAGGANGYCVVLELDDKEQPVSIIELMHFITAAESAK
ncbi:MAG: hypothetical protein H0W12_06480 [Chitinophagaceae bacterium]|nr:hypothetical protein [Chitinophagaceae bacterium]